MDLGEGGSKHRSTRIQEFFVQTRTAFRRQELLRIFVCASVECLALIGKQPNSGFSLQQYAVMGGDSS